MRSPQIYFKFSSVYFFFYLGLGSVLPLFSLYMKFIGMTGTQIGTLTAIGAFIGIFAGPLWGYVSDKTHFHKGILLLLFSATIVTAFLITTTSNYILLIGFIIIYNFSLSPINPLLDGIVLHSPLPFGKVRLWGSIGFALSAYGTGLIAEHLGLIIIFYSLMLCSLIAMVFFKSTSIAIESSEGINLGSLSRLFTNPNYIAFLIYTMLLTSTFGGNNTYFGLYFESIGGNVALVGLAFLLFAISEVPLMHWIAKYLNHHTPYKMLVLAPIAGITRWLLFAMVDKPIIILFSFFLQGLFYAPILLGAAEYIRLELPPSLRSTATALTAALGFGLGGIFINFISGYIYDHMPVANIYWFYTILCLIAVGISPYIYKNRKIR